MIVTNRGPRCTTLHLLDMNGRRWVIHAYGMTSQISCITRYNCTMVSGGGSRDLIWQSVRSIADARWGTGQWVPGQGGVWTVFDIGQSCVRQIEAGRRYIVTRWSLAARHCLFRMGLWCGRRECSVNRLRWLRMVSVDILSLWRPGVSATVLVDGLHWYLGW